jgi:hypothetical protein
MTAVTVVCMICGQTTPITDLHYHWLPEPTRGRNILRTDDLVADG